MTKFRWFALMLILQSIIWIAAGIDCEITQYMVEGTRRIYMYRDGSGSYQLQRSQFVKNGVTLYLVCTEDNVREITCNDGKFTLDSALVACHNPLQTSAKMLGSTQCDGNLYGIGYSIGGQHLELYRSCYDARIGRVWYAESDVYWKSFFARRPFVEFTTDGVVTPAEATSYIKGNIFNAITNTFGSQYISNNGALVINRGHLVASADFLFADQMISTFRYLNIVPQFKDINDGNWEKIERWIRSMVPRDSYFHIKTGGIDILLLQDMNSNWRKVFLNGGSRLPVPYWTYKVVRDANGNYIYAFLTYNCTFFEKCISPPRDFCEEVKCPLSLPSGPKNGFTYCCNPNKFPY